MAGSLAFVWLLPSSSVWLQELLLLHICCCHAELTNALGRLQAQLSTLQLDARLSNALLQLGKARMLGGLGDPSKSASSSSSSSRLALIG
jgi:hypothetical protein